MPENLADNEEGPTGWMQDVLRKRAAASSYMAERTAALKEAKVDVDKALAFLQQQKARAQALVRGASHLRRQSYLYVMGKGQLIMA